MRQKNVFGKSFGISTSILLCLLAFSPCRQARAITPVEYQAIPIEGSKSIPPLVMLVMGRNQKLYYEAYNDTSDLNGDGQLDIRYNPAIDYYGYFDSYKYYAYDSAYNRFEPVGATINGKKKPAGDYWSGDFLNYLTMSRIDVLRKVLYGGYRSVDTASETVLERAYIPNDSHCWGKEYSDPATDGYDISDYTPFSVPDAGKRHLFACGSLVAPGEPSYAPLLRVKLNSDKRIWTWVSAESADGIMGNTVVGTPDHDYDVRVLVGVSSMPESNCKKYPDGDYKPIGILQRYGEPDRMYFGLITGSYENNLSGGVLRKNIRSFTDEIDSDTGQFKYKTDSSVGGIVKTIDNFRVIGFNHKTHYWDATVYNRPIHEGEDYMWGNPIAEMMYESLRYFAGAGATPDYSSGITNGNDRGLDLPLETWQNPYDTYPHCAKPVMLVISDINPSYDTDQLPGVDSLFNTGFTGTLGTLNVASGLDTISTVEGIDHNMYYIGQSGSDFDTACSGKMVDSLSSIRGLCPEEPTKLGGYYSASVAYYGHTTDLSTAEGDQKTDTYVVGLSSPLPKIEIPMGGGKVITMVPFAKTVLSSSGGGVSPARGSFQPTCSIADFYVEELTPTYGKFRISFEHAEQGSDFDMDGLVSYEYTKNADNTLTVTVTNINEVPGGSSRQHFGYIISGTNDDGIYLEAMNRKQTPYSDDPDYYLDTPDGYGPNQGPSDYHWKDGVPLPTSHARTFTPSGSAPATLLKNPLYYAAKWGGFDDQNGNDIPDIDSEWDSNHDGTPDHYFYVTNPLELEEQLNASLGLIAANTASGTSASVLASSDTGDGTLLQAYFRPITETTAGEVKWLGALQSLWVDDHGLVREDTNGNLKLDPSVDKILQFDVVNGETKIKRYDVSAGNPYPDLTTSGYDWVNMDEIHPIWEAGSVLANTAPSDRHIFTTTDGSALTDFTTTNKDSIKNLLGVTDADITRFPDANIDLLGSDVDSRAQTLIQYVRGTDSTSLRSRTVDGKVWKLGDIVHSTPVSVSKPVEQYDAIYSDPSYGAYYSAEKNRQTVVYVGGNDGMLHAFTAWKYNSATDTFDEPPSTERYGNQGETIGDELWAYIPKALLPHLKWLSDPQYAHSYYVDLTPKIFDAKIAGASHDQWGTFLLLGLNMGGKDIDVGPASSPSTFKPSYTLLDITDPVNPKLMWERTYEGMGMSRSTPCVIKVGGTHFDVQGQSITPTSAKWLAVFGSGPHGDYAYDGVSDQPGRIFVVDLVTGDPIGENGHDYLFTTSDNATINSPVALDKGLTYEVNALYFGESIIANPSNPTSGWTGKAWSIDTYGSWVNRDPNGDLDPDYWPVTTDPTRWHSHLLLKEFRPVQTGNPPATSLGPITAPMAVSVDWFDNVWVYFGTGRYLSQDDTTDTHQQYLFGLKDPLFAKARNYASAAYVSGADQNIDKDKLLNASRYRIKADRTVEYFDDSNSWVAFGDWQKLLDLVRQSSSSDTDWLDGWSRNLMVTVGPPPLPSERCISKFSILGGAVFAPAYSPSEDVCEFGGTSTLYGLYFETGTPYYKALLPPNTGTYMEDKTTVGQGAPPPISGIAINKSESGKAFLQLSTGAVVEVNVNSALKLKSRMVDWHD
jgi:type IV pilus assembly protein PilY1